MESRFKKYASQLGKKINDPGAHIPTAAVGLLRKRRRQDEIKKELIKAGSKVPALVSDNPFPNEYA